jgi:hypothetical protein
MEKVPAGVTEIDRKLLSEENKPNLSIMQRNNSEIRSISGAWR